MAEEEFDAIVVGSGISGGWAAKELTEKGLRVLLLERGKNVEHIKDYVNARKGPWEYAHRGRRTTAMAATPGGVSRAARQFIVYRHPPVGRGGSVGRPGTAR